MFIVYALGYLILALFLGVGARIAYNSRPILIRTKADIIDNITCYGFALIFLLLSLLGIISSVFVIIGG